MNNKLTEKLEALDPSVGRVYEQDPGNLSTVQILYVDTQIVVLRRDERRRSDENAHRLERRTAFDDRVRAGFYELAVPTVSNPNF